MEAENEPVRDLVVYSVKELELRRMALDRDLVQSEQEMKQLAQATRVIEEQIGAVGQRYADVVSELNNVRGQLQSEEALEFALTKDTSAEKLMSYREAAQGINTAFKRALRKRLGDPEFIDRLSARGAGTGAEYCRVEWEGEAADWKVHDPSDGTDVTFGTMLEDVSRYWGVPEHEFALHDEKKAIWPLEAVVWEEMQRAPKHEVVVKLMRRPLAVVLSEFEVEYEEDESKLPVAVRRERERERRAALLKLHSIESAKKERERQRRALVAELWKYCVFMGMLFLVTMLRRSVPDAHYMLNALDEVFVGEEFGDYNEKAYMDIRTFEEFYEWAEGPFLQGLLPGEYYDGTVIDKDKNRVAYYNRVVGGVRMRQLRVEPNKGCDIATNVVSSFTPTAGPDAGVERTRKYVQACYTLYSVKQTAKLKPSQSTAAYSVMFNRTGNATEATNPLERSFTWQDAAALGLADAADVEGQFGIYDGSGFVMDVTNLTTSYLTETFTYLKDNDWLDRQTRGVFISMVVYNHNFNLCSLATFFIELSPAGVMLPTYKFQTIKFDLYTNLDSEYLGALIMEAILYSGLLYVWINEFREVYSTYQAEGSVLGYFQDAWNVMDWSLIILSFLALTFRVVFVTSPRVANFSLFAESYQEVSSLANMYNNSFVIDSLAAFIGIFKVFRYFELQRNLHILRQSIARGIGDLAVFTGMLLLMIFGFSITGMHIFGQENAEWTDIIKSYTSLFLTLLGEFDFDAMYRVQPVGAYVFFLVFQVFVFFIMVNIFLAILNDAYIAVTEQFAENYIPGDKEPLTMRQRFRRLRRWFRQRTLDARIEKLRAAQRKRELAERRVARKREEERLKTLKSMGVEITAAVLAGAMPGGSGKRAGELGRGDSGDSGRGGKIRLDNEEPDREDDPDAMCEEHDEGSAETDSGRRWLKGAGP